MKFIARTVVLLLIVNILLIYMHYKQAGDVVAKESDVREYRQEIEVMNRSDALYINHHFSGLSSGRFEIVWPEASTERSCYSEETAACDRLDDDATAFLDGNNDRQSISYKIPKEGPMQPAVLFNEPFAMLHGTTVTSTLFHLTDETGIGGMWVNGLERVAVKEMDLIDYSYFRGAGGVKDLYWQRNSLPLAYDGKKLDVYGLTQNAAEFEAVDNALKAIDANHSTIVIDGRNAAVRSERFIVSESTDVDKVSDLFLTSTMFDRFSIPAKEPIIAEVMASILGDKETGTKKSRQSYARLTEVLTEEELGQLQVLLSNRAGQAIDAAALDGAIGEVTGFKTSYFAKTVRDDTKDHLFLIEDPREIQLDGVANEHVRVVLKDGKTLYPAKRILETAGFSITTNERSIYIENDMRKFRFPKNELFYVYNERKYDVVTTPFEVLEGDIYFEESLFKRLFLFNIEKTADTVNIVNLSTLIEEAVK